MREILFRQAIYRKGVFDSWHNWGFVKIADKFDCFKSPETSFTTIEGAAVNSCQYTGLKDKNGKKIFEGDIVKFHDFADGTTDRYLCKFGRYYGGNYGYYFHNLRHKEQYFFNASSCEIIGNETENPELMKEDDDEDNR